MTKGLMTKSALLLSTMFIALNAQAHHSFQATFKSDAEITVEGVVTDYRFKNPHVLVFLDVTNDDGSVTEWMSEGGSATSKRRDGWDRNTLQAGQKVRITGDSTHDGSPMVSIGSIEILDAENGAVVKTLGEQAGTGRPQLGGMVPLKLKDGRPNLTGAWDRVRGGSRGGSPEELDGVPPFNAAGKAAQAAYNRADDPQIGSIVTAKMIVTDPGYLSEPWELNRERFYSEGYEFIENECRSPLRERTVKKS